MTASLTAALALKPDLGLESPRLASPMFARARISPASLTGVTFAHAGLMGLLFLAPATPEPVTPARPLTVTLIEPEVVEPEPEPEPQPKPAPPKPVVKPLPPPPVLVANTPTPTPQPVIEAPKPVPVPEPVPEVLPPPPPPQPVVVAEAPTPAPPPTPPRPADYLNNPKPPYPALSKRLGEEGVVWLRALISADGSVSQLELLKSSGHQRLDDIAYRTVKNSWQFEPARRSGKPVAEWVNFPVDFKLTRS